MQKYFAYSAQAGAQCSEQLLRGRGVNRKLDKDLTMEQ